MNYRTLLITCLAAGIVASCSQSPKKEFSPAVPDISKTDRSNLIEVNASIQPPAPSAGFRPAPVTAPEPVVTRRRVEFTIGDEGPAPAPATRSTANYSENSDGPLKLAPSYEDRPVPTRGMSRDMVVADLGQPANRLAGSAGSEVWDYGTLRVFFHNEAVAFTKVW